MVPSAVTAALGLLRKVMPDLASVEHSGQIDTMPVPQMTDEQLDADIAQTSALIAGEEAPSSDPGKLH